MDFETIKIKLVLFKLREYTESGIINTSFKSPIKLPISPSPRHPLPDIGSAWPAPIGLRKVDPQKDEGPEADEAQHSWNIILDESILENSDYNHTKGEVDMKGRRNVNLLLRRHNLPHPCMLLVPLKTFLLGLHRTEGEGEAPGTVGAAVQGGHGTGAQLGGVGGGEDATAFRS